MRQQFLGYHIFSSDNVQKLVIWVNQEAKFTLVKLSQDLI